MAISKCFEVFDISANTPVSDQVSPQARKARASCTAATEILGCGVYLPSTRKQIRFEQKAVRKNAFASRFFCSKSRR
jgi:hypothetical protein